MTTIWEHRIELVEPPKLSLVETLKSKLKIQSNETHKAINDFKIINNIEGSLLGWILRQPNLDLTSRDTEGYTDLEKARLMGKGDLVDLIENHIRSQRKDITLTPSRKFSLKERNEDGSPIIAFVKIDPGTYRKGDEREESSRNTVTLKKPFKIMSVPTTKRMWKEVVLLAQEKLKKSNKSVMELDPYPSKIKEDEQHPVVKIKDSEIIDWIKVLNELSKLNIETVQNKLKILFPGHSLGQQYRLPTSDEWEYVARVRGVSVGRYTHSFKHVDHYAWYNKNSGYSTQSVGLKKPILIKGNPIYDIFGNVFEVVQNTNETKPEPHYIYRGGSARYPKEYLPSGKYEEYPQNKSNHKGFRLVSDIP